MDAERRQYLRADAIGPKRRTAFRGLAGMEVGGDAVRAYGTGAQILAALGIHDMILLSNTHHAPVGLSGYGLAIVEERPIKVDA